MQKSPDYKRYLTYLFIISALVRIIFASILELTNDEANYWTYALYPALSYFDHPPVVGWLIRISTFNLILTDEIFVRLSSIIIGIINTIIIFKIGKYIKDETSGFYAALLYNASIYCFLITGIFIMPDTPQILFWLLSIYYFLRSIIIKEIKKNSKHALLLAGVFTGLALLSKYHSIFLWIGALLFIILYNRKWLKTKELYFSILISIIIFLPALIWNYQNNFISFTFQGERADLLKSGIRFDYFLTELAGEIIYNNPILFILSILTLINIKKIKLFNDNLKGALLLFALPNIFIFLFISLFRKTLPHWNGPGYVTFIILISIYLAQKENLKKVFKIPASIFSALILLLIVLILGYVQINFSLFSQGPDNNAKSTELGRNDVTLDMYGWKQLQEKFILLNDIYKQRNLLDQNCPLITNKWYNAGHIDYYLGRIMNKKVYCAGNLNDIRNYYFVNKDRGDLEFGKDAFYISPSRDFKDPNEILKNSFFEIYPIDTIHIYRNKEPVENVFVFKLSKYIGKRFY